jgi:hypothetical protein
VIPVTHDTVYLLPSANLPDHWGIIEEGPIQTRQVITRFDLDRNEAENLAKNLNVAAPLNTVYRVVRMEGEP